MLKNAKNTNIVFNNVCCDPHDKLAIFKEHILKFFQGDKIDKEHMLLRKLLNKTFKVKISDGRTLVGSFLCTDKDQNVILGQCQEYVKPNGK